MSTHASLVLLAALGVLSSFAHAQGSAPDTSKWKCESCPYPKGTSGTVDVGIGVVSDEAPRFGDYTGLDRDGAHLLLGGTVTARSNGYYADVVGGQNFTRTLAARSGREGLYEIGLRFVDIPRHLSQDAQTPFGGVGSDRLTLPAGFAAATTAAMPLAATLQPVDLGYSYRRYDLSGRLRVAPGWNVGLSLRRDTRDGTRGLGASFFSTAAQLAAPVDHVTDQLEASVAYASRQWQAKLAYQLSEFKNGAPSLTWDNPFAPAGSTAATGQLALAPDNRLQQVVGSAGWTYSPAIRISGDFAVGRLTQNEPFLAPTLNTGLAVPALPRASLDGKVDLFNGSIRASVQTPIEALRVSASYTHDLRDDETDRATWPSVSTDLFVGLSPDRTNTPLRHVRDRAKVVADWRGPEKIKLSGGLEYEQHERSFSEVVESRETAVFVRGSWQARDELGISANWRHAERDHSTYGVAVWFGAPENPLLRKYNLAERTRDSGGVRVDFTPTDALALGLALDAADDRYDNSAIGLKSARSVSLGADASYSVSDNTRLSAFVHGEQIRSRHAGSGAFAAPDWSARSKDRFEMIGATLQHAAIPDKLDIGAEVTVTRARSTLRVDSGVGEDPFPNAKTTLDTVRLFANYKLTDRITLLGSVWSERHKAQDWQLDGVLPDTVSNLLAFGAQPTRHEVQVLRLAVRYRF